MLAGKIYSQQLADVVEDLITYIWGFESEIFSASESNMTRQEAEILAAQVIQQRCYFAAYEIDDFVLAEKLASLRFCGGIDNA